MVINLFFRLFLFEEEERVIIYIGAAAEKTKESYLLCKELSELRSENKSYLF